MDHRFASALSALTRLLAAPAVDPDTPWRFSLLGGLAVSPTAAACAMPEGIRP